MNIIHINNYDLIGRRFNGYDLHLSLIEKGYTSYQLVIEKLGNSETTIQICGDNELFLRKFLKVEEYKLSMPNLLNPFCKVIYEHPQFLSSDIVHYHLIHNSLISILDFERLTSLKPSVWTIHDPWALTGHCIHPLECEGWLDGCLLCNNLNNLNAPMQIDKASDIWKIKKQAYENMDLDIVVASNFMVDYLKRSPLTRHFKNIHKIPFGIDVNKFSQSNKKIARQNLKISDNSFVISFRAESNEIKGLKYIIEMLNNFYTNENITILAIGYQALPLYLKEKYSVIELGWQDDPNILYDFYAASDVFIMPSLAESFGLMAIEAMASGCPVIVFDNTVLTEITFAPECGISVPYKNAEKLRKAVQHLIENPDECKWRGEKGKEIVKKYYKYENYVKAHVELYKEILRRNNSR